jgi:hypothetical protein
MEVADYVRNRNRWEAESYSRVMIILVHFIPGGYHDSQIMLQIVQWD